MASSEEVVSSTEGPDDDVGSVSEQPSMTSDKGLQPFGIVSSRAVSLDRDSNSSFLDWALVKLSEPWNRQRSQFLIEEGTSSKLLIPTMVAREMPAEGKELHLGGDSSHRRLQSVTSTTSISIGTSAHIPCTWTVRIDDLSKCSKCLFSSSRIFSSLPTTHKARKSRS